MQGCLFLYAAANVINLGELAAVSYKGTYKVQMIGLPLPSYLL